MMTYRTVAGTEDWDPPEDGLNLRWWQRSSVFSQIMTAHGCARTGWSYQGLDLPPWSTQLAGTWVSGRDIRTWWRGAYGLAWELEQQPPETRTLICHSHGGQVGVLVAWILRESGGLARLVTVCTPRRRAMRQYYEAVDCPWLHIYNTNLWANRMQWLGARAAGWTMPAPAENVCVKGIGHSALLREPDRFAAVYQDVLLPFLRGLPQRP